MSDSEVAATPSGWAGPRVSQTSAGSSQTMLLATPQPASHAILESQVSAFIASKSHAELGGINVSALRGHLESLNHLSAGTLKPISGQLRAWFVHHASLRISEESAATQPAVVGSNGDASANPRTYPSPSAPAMAVKQEIRTPTHPRVLSSTSTFEHNQYESKQQQHDEENGDADNGTTRPLSFGSVAAGNHVKTPAIARTTIDQNRESLRHHQSASTSQRRHRDAELESIENHRFDNGGHYDAPNDEPERSSKRPRVTQTESINESDSDLTVRVAGQVADLGGDKLVTASVFHGHILAHFRQYFWKDGRRVPTQKGVALSEAQWRQFKQVIPRIDAIFDAGADTLQDRLDAEDGQRGDSGGDSWRGGGRGGGRSGCSRATDQEYEPDGDDGDSGGSWRGGRGRGGRGGWRGGGGRGGTNYNGGSKRGSWSGRRGGGGGYSRGSY